MNRLRTARMVQSSLTAAVTGLATALFVMFAMLDMALFGVTVVERVAYVFIYLGVILAVFVVLSSEAVDRRIWAFVAMWLFTATFWLLPAARQTVSYPSYVAGDLLSVALPAILVVLGGANGLFSPGRLRVLAVALLVAACIAPLIGVENNRFEPPATLLTAIVWTAILQANRAPRRLALVGVAIALLVLASMSGQRTALVVWLGCAGFVCWRLLQSTAMRVLAVAAGAVILAAVGATTMREQALGLLAGHRMESLARGEQDESLLSRVQEASDVLATFSREGSTLTYLTGFGHGATYRPEASFLARNVTAEGRVHNVHIGPLMIFFRYGLIGLAAYAWLLFVIIRVLLGGRAATRRRDSPVTAFALASGGYLLEGLMFNVWVDPMFSFALAGLMASVLDEQVGRQAVHDPRPAGVISRQGLKA